MTVAELDRWLSSFLDIGALEGIDSSQNGLQVGSALAETTRVAFAVDASMESFRRAAQWGAGLLVVHHGIIWAAPQRIVGSLFERVRFLAEKNLALYAAHLPLDKHPEVGNNIGIAHLLGLQDIAPFGTWRGVTIGCRGVLAEPMSLEQVVTRLSGRQGEPMRTLPFGPPMVRSVGIVSGAAPRAGDIGNAVAGKLDLFITGEPSHEVYHHCLEERIHVIFAGHYHSESFGVRLLADRLARETGVETTYLDIPTGL
jgi:dinuclear metal center YbgI/SA1388 family protein